MQKVSVLDSSTIPKMASHENIVVIVQYMESNQPDYYSTALKCLSSFFVHEDSSIV